jgi:hypothetical protein
VEGALQPGAAYLAGILTGALGAVAIGGTIFVLLVRYLARCWWRAL